MRLNKLRQYLRIAVTYGQELSKDNSSKVGAFFLHPTEFTMLTSGYNGMPRGARDDAPGRLERPIKYSYFEHAELNAIFNAVREQFRGTSLVTNETLTINAVRAIISVGVKNLYLASDDAPQVLDPVSAELLRETGVTVTPIAISAKCATAEVRAWKPHWKQTHAFYSSLSTMATSPEGTLVTAFVSETSSVESHLLRTVKRLPELGPGPGYSTILEAIFDAARPVLEGSACVVSHRPCADCGLAIGAVGAAAVACVVQEDYETRWAASVASSKAQFARLGIPVHEFQSEDLFPEKAAQLA